MNEFIDCIKNKYVCFDGRARRREYWMFVLFSTLVGVGVSIVAVILGYILHSPGFSTLIDGLYHLALILPGSAVLFRRLHDTGRSGWWWLINLIPLIGTIILLIILCLDSQPGENKYGPNPKGF